MQKLKTLNKNKDPFDIVKIQNQRCLRTLPITSAKVVLEKWWGWNLSWRGREGSDRILSLDNSRKLALKGKRKDLESNFFFFSLSYLLKRRDARRHYLLLQPYDRKNLYFFMTSDTNFFINNERYVKRPHFLFHFHYQKNQSLIWASVTTICDIISSIIVITFLSQEIIL